MLVYHLIKQPCLVQNNLYSQSPLIFDNWREEAFDYLAISKKPDVKSAFGLDFGYTNDPTALFCVQLMANGLKPYPISLDNYFVDREKTPKDEKGDYDYESLYLHIHYVPGRPDSLSANSLPDPAQPSK